MRISLSSDPDTCFDESEKCEVFAKERKCINHERHDYANFCKKSCGLCGKSTTILLALAESSMHASVPCSTLDIT